VLGELVGAEEQLVGAAELACLQEKAGHGEGELRVAVQDLVGDLERHLAEQVARAVHEAAEPVFADQFGGELPSRAPPPRGGALERLPVRGVPPARRAVQGRQLVREAVPELGPEHLGEQGVVAEPCARRVQRVDEALGLGELARARRPSGVPVSASASSAFTRSTIDVLSRKPSLSSS
jgi:hypothetical protein